MDPAINSFSFSFRICTFRLLGDSARQLLLGPAGQPKHPWEGLVDLDRVDVAGDVLLEAGDALVIAGDDLIDLISASPADTAVVVGPVWMDGASHCDLTSLNFIALVS